MRTAAFHPLLALLLLAAPASASPHQHHHQHHTAEGYALSILDEGAIKPGTNTHLVLDLRAADSSRVTEFDVVHEKRVHLLLISRDLRTFLHVHPEAQRDGRLHVPVTFPAAGTYTAFADFKPRGKPATVTRREFVVGNAPAAERPDLQASELNTPRQFGPWSAGLYTQPLRANADQMLTFHIARDGHPPELKPYLGALGHAVIISEDGGELIHAHPLPASRPGHVTFHVRFPKPGRYKMWAEFRPDGEPLMTDQVLQVSDGAGTN